LLWRRRSPRLALAMKGSHPGKLPPPSPTSTPERVCAAPGCRTKLSIYNLGNTCWQHADLVFPNYRGKRLAAGKA
jgi:hypothetical protein